MSQSHRKEVAKKLKDAIAAATDPNVIAQLSNQLSKYLPRPRQARRPRKAEATPTPSSSKKVSIIDRITGSTVDHLPDGEKVLHYLVVEVEKRQREQHREFNSEEFKAEFTKLVDGLSARDRAALESWKPEKVA